MQQHTDADIYAFHQTDVNTVRSQVEKTHVGSQQNHCEETLQFVQNAIDNLKDGERITIEYSQENGKKNNRVDLYKGISKIETTKESKTNTSSITLSGWKAAAVTLIVAIPWVV
jgi:hypothetical protein